MGARGPGFLRLGRSAGNVGENSSEEGAAVAPVGWFRSNRGIATALILLTLVIGISIWTSDWAHREVRDGFKLGFFPIFAIVMILISLGMMAIDSRARSTTEAIRDLRPAEAGIVVLLLAALGGLFLLIPFLGFAVVIFLIVFGGALLLGYRPVWIALVTGLMTAAAMHGLTIVLNVQFPAGLLGIIGG